jgi:hypothetical protein
MKEHDASSEDGVDLTVDIILLLVRYLCLFAVIVDVFFEKQHDLRLRKWTVYFFAGNFFLNFFFFFKTRGSSKGENTFFLPYINQEVNFTWFMYIQVMFQYLLWPKNVQLWISEIIFDINFNKYSTNM